MRKIDTDDGRRLSQLSRRLLRILICYRYLREGLFVKASKSDDGFCSAPSITESDEKPKPIYWKSHESNTLSFTPSSCLSDEKLVIYRIKLPGPAIIGEVISIVQFVFVIVVLLPVNKRGLLHSPKPDFCQKVSSFELDDSLVHCVLPKFEVEDRVVQREEVRRECGKGFTSSKALCTWLVTLRERRGCHVLIFFRSRRV
ncbi:hypothetical protein IGI04_002035 [Brassica rapa subsp. trilocularis]|uniref:Uncharacterized protein n=1 Tax=Brassica rapa subsp. trilocularis TaxID=1813537 RepID=A0ABQ7NUD9_BRACM|nr:hypothetical protein IGI04_002035 [Brassica rapa subsp. trilocularis]